MAADILIRGMDMPENEPLTITITPEGKVFRAFIPGSYGEAFPFPKGHGRLIDAERFRVILCRLKERQNDDVAIHALNWAIECLDKLDTIVPAEGGGEDGV